MNYENKTYFAYIDTLFRIHKIYLLIILILLSRLNRM